MPAMALKKLQAWLSACPYWEDALQVGFLPVALEEISQQIDVVGNRLVGYRYYVDLKWQMAEQGNNEESACKLLDFQNWIREQSILGNAPQLGDVPAMERIHTEKGGFTPGAQPVSYTITLVADFVKAYGVNV